MKPFTCTKHFNLPTTYPLQFVVLDFEMTGLSPLSDEIIQIGAILYEAGKPVKMFKQNVNPLREIPSNITELTGISNDDVFNAPTISDVLPSLIQFIDHYPIVAHNAAFDINVLNRNLMQYDYPPVKNMIIDTLKMAKSYAPFTVDNYKLETLKRAMDITIDSHTAINDCLVTGELYLECRTIVELLSKNV
ncbi:MAG TPA: hypothetical protein DCY20_05725 [Firmicutes bacterium]|nr:hypothetical protein [Bacillota bacterium]